MSTKENPDGLRYPSIDEILTKIDSKYKLAYTAAKRAKIIDAEGHSSLEDEGGNKCYTSVGKALEEIQADKIQVEFKDTAEDALTHQNTFGTSEISAESEDQDY